MILIAAGSNLPFRGIDSQQLVLSAFRALGSITKIIAQSSLYQSKAWPDPADPPFINAACAIETDISPEVLLSALHALENAFGRVRERKNAARTLDLDLIAYNELIQPEPARLVLPHPRLEIRDFVLVPLGEIAPAWRSPVSAKTPIELLSGLETCDVRKIDL